jgi:CNT family concentrative nucleoside transporter
MNILFNLISFFGIFGLCLVAWIFSEEKKVIPWRVIGIGIALQLILGFFVFQFPPTRIALEWFSTLLDSVFIAADTGARFVFGQNLVPLPGQDPFILRAIPVGMDACPPPQQAIADLPGYCGTARLNYALAFRALPAVIFFSGLMALLYNIGVIQVITNFFAIIFYRTMRLSGAESLSGAANIFVGIEAAIVVKPYLEKMTRSELCAILACCFGTSASSTLAIYVSFLKPVFPNILGHLVSASIMAIPACFVLAKILVPETGKPFTMGGIPTEEESKAFEASQKGENFNELSEEEPVLEDVGGEKMHRVSPLDAAIVGALDGVKMAVAIAAVLIIILGLVSLFNQFFGFLGNIPGEVGVIFKNYINLANIQGVLFYPLTIMTGVPFNESWEASVLIGRRLLETAIPPYQALAAAALRPDNPLSPRTVLIVSYALSGFAHLASVGIFVGGTIALAPSRRRDISALGWKALFAGTLATLMIACVAGVFDNGTPSILGQ